MKQPLKHLIFISFLCLGLQFNAQDKTAVINAIVEEAYQHSQLEPLAHQLLDVVGPRLVGTPQMQQAHDWVVNTYAQWGISANNEKWGVWKGWERGITHIDLIAPRVQTLKGIQLAWSPSTPKGGIAAEVVAIPTVSDSLAFSAWLKTIKGKAVLTSMYQASGRPDYNWEAYATEATFEKMKQDRDSLTQVWRANMYRTGYNRFNIDQALEAAGATAVLTSYWSKGFGANKIFGARTKTIPTIDIELEDYGLLYRLAVNGNKPKIKLEAQSKPLEKMPALNTIGRIEGKEKPNEYVILSAHLDSWDGATGATDNGTGTILMMEVMRILKKIYPNPKRTILVGHWGSEEQGLNGSRAFVQDHPEIVKNVQVVLNQDNGTGRVVEISGAGFLHAYNYITKWLAAVPYDVRKHVETDFPGSPSGGGSDNASFVAAGVPAFFLNSLSWSYGNYTWHTNRDTYDKIVFDEVRNNVVLTAIMAYMASEDPEMASREQIELPINSRTGAQRQWPEVRSPNRAGN